MLIRKTPITLLSILSAFLILLGITQCTKQGTNSTNVSRALIQTPDSAIFSPFYDSVVIDKTADVPRINDVIKDLGVQSIIKSNCASSTCHGGAVKPTLLTYTDIKSLVTPGNPEGSELFQLITTSELNKAMPPVNYGVDLSATEKAKIYNWIKNGANEKPTLADFRPAAISLISVGCASANCHNEATIGGEWARKGSIVFTSADTINLKFYSPTGTVTNLAQLQNPLLSTVWNLYKDSVRKFYADTLANASFRPFKTFTTPWTTASKRGPLNTYDDILLDINYPKGRRSNTGVVYTNGSGVKYYAYGDPYNTTSSLIQQIDSTIVQKNMTLSTWGTVGGKMAWDDGGLKSSEVALIKAWYFADPNIPDVWKYGKDGAGIFKYNATGKLITK